MGITVSVTGYMYNRKIKYGREDGTYEKKLGKNNQNYFGCAGPVILYCHLLVAAFLTAPNGIIMGGATGIGLTDQPLFSGEPVADHFGNQCGAVRSRCNIFLGKKFALTTIISSLFINIPVDGTVHSRNRQK